MNMWTSRKIIIDLDGQNWKDNVSRFGLNKR